MSAADSVTGDPVAPVSFRPELFQSNPPALIGSECTACGRRAFPPREVCPQCGAVAESHPVELSRHGVVYSFTIVHQAPPGLTTPYLLGYVDLPEDEVRVMSRIEGEVSEVAIGAPADLVVHENELDPDGESVIFAFAVSRNQEDER